MESLALNGILFAVLTLCIGSYAAAFTARWPIKNLYLWEKEAHQLLSLPFHRKIPDYVNNKRSYCVSCQHPLKWIDLIPLLSYFILRGKCRYCNGPISIRYPAIEAAHLICCFPLFWITQDTYQLVLHSIMFSALLSAAVVDLENQFIPDECCTIALACALLIHLPTNTLDVSVLGMILGYSLVYFLRWSYLKFKGQEGIGLGDAKIIAALGAWLGLSGLPSMLLCASLSGILYTVITSRNKAKYMAFGPFLILSAMMVFYFNL